MLVAEILPVLFSKKSNRFIVRLEDGSDFILYKKEINRFNIEVNSDISDEDYEEILSEILTPRAKLRAMHLLEKMDRTEADLRKKLKEGHYPDKIIDQAVEYVSNYNYINDARYTENYIRYKSKSKSQKRILMDLSNKGIDKHLIENVIWQMEAESEGPVFDDYQIIVDYIQKKIQGKSNIDEKKKQSIYNHLLREGFSNSDISRGFRELNSWT